MHRYKRGDSSPCGQYRFWCYTQGTEAWMSPGRFEKAHEKTKHWSNVAKASPQAIKEIRKEAYLATHPKAQPKNTNK